MLGRRRCLPWLLPQVLGQILLVLNRLAGSSLANKTIHVGYLLQYMERAGAINVAIEQARDDGLLREYNFRWVYTVMRHRSFRNFRCIAESIYISQNNSAISRKRTRSA